MNFIGFRDLVNEQIKTMTKHTLFEVEVDPDTIKNKYLSSFKEGDNPIYIENTEHDCSCCKRFIRNLGKAVSIIDGKLVSVWDVPAEGKYKPVAEEMSKFIKSLPIKGIYLNDESVVGLKSNKELVDGQTKTWDHFYYKLPTDLVKPHTLQKDKGDFISSKGVLERSLEEISLESTEIVLELISSNAIYRGSEHKATVTSLLKYKKAYLKLPTKESKELFLWSSAATLGFAGRFKNTVIGTLLADISEGMELEKAVKAFESKVAPDNYKRPKALITKGMINRAELAIEKLGLKNDLQRRPATEGDLTINNILFANKSTKPKLLDDEEEGGVLDLLKGEVKQTPKQSLKGVKEVSIGDFISNILPKAETLELMLSNTHTSNLMSLVAPVNNTESNLLKWGNNFTWSYSGEVADSMKEQVVSRGGRVDGVFRFTHSWNHRGGNNSLMDLHMFFPNNTFKFGVHDKFPSGRRIGWNNRVDGVSGGSQDVDYTEQAPKNFIPLENITIPSLKGMPNGVYPLAIHNWNARSRNTEGFHAEVEFGGNLYQYSYDKPLKHKEWVHVADVTLLNGEFSIEHKLPTNSQQKESWNVTTNTWQPVKMVLNSPNHWDGEETGNKHWFFILEDCVNPDDMRGFYNEFLNPELTEHRKVFEVLASKMKAKHTKDQLSGVGFSSTKADEILCKVGGSFNRVIKIKF